MKKFKLEIDCTNDVFGDEPEFEVARILQDVSDAMHDYAPHDGKLRDANGNVVGRYTFEE